MKKLFLMLGMALAVVSCSKDIDSSVDMTSGEGAVRLGVTTKAELSTDDNVVVKIYKVEGKEQKLIRRYEAMADVPEYLALLEGDYVAKVQVGEKRAVSFDTKYYLGEENFSIEPGNVTPVTVDCKLQSTVVVVNYDATVVEKLKEGYFTTVAIAESYDSSAIATGDVLALTYEESKEGYVVMPEGETSLYWHFEGVRPDEGDIVKEGLIENIKPSAKYTITLKYSKDAPGNLVFEAIVDESIEEYEDVIIFSPDPTILGDGFDVGEVQLSTTASRAYNVASLATISTMTLTVSGVEYNLLNINSVPAGIDVVKSDDLTYKVTVNKAFFTQVTGGEQALTFHIEDVDGGKLTKDINYRVQGVMPLATTDYDLWFGNVTFKATVVDIASSVKIAYSADGTTWTEVEAVEGANGVYTAVDSNFTVEKNYTYKLVIDGVDAGKALTHQTAAGTQIPNGDMESWSKKGDVIYPYAAGASAFWLTGNEGSNMAGKTLTKSSTDVRPGSTGQYSAHLTSLKAAVLGIGKFAAGNLFTGTFSLSGMNGTVGFGRDFKFTAKPKSMSFWMKHNEGTINENAGTPAEATGIDKATIMVAITNWDAPYGVNTADQSTFFSMADLATMEGVIGYGYIEKRESATEWAEYTIDITYREDMKNVKPKKIVVSFTPSGFGDYFTGSTDSWMYVDDIVLNY